MVRHQDAVQVSEAAMARAFARRAGPRACKRWGRSGDEAASRPHGSLLDGGHNPQAAQALADLSAEHAERRVDAIIGMMAAKDAREFLAILAPYLSRVVALPIEGIDHVAPEELAALRARLACRGRRCG